MFSSKKLKKIEIEIENTPSKPEHKETILALRHKENLLRQKRILLIEAA